MAFSKETVNEKTDAEHRFIRKWREVVAETEKLDVNLLRIENERETAMLEKQVLEQKLRGLKDAHSGEEDSRIISNMQTEIEKYSHLAAQEETHADDLELWCSKRQAKNQTHLDALQQKSHRIRQAEAESAEMDVLPLAATQSERQIDQINDDLAKLIRSVHQQAESLDLSFRLAIENEVLFETHGRVTGLESLLTDGAVDVAELSAESHKWEARRAHRRGLLGEIEKELRATMEKSLSTIRTVRNELNGIDPCEFSALDILHSMVSEGKLYTEGGAVLQGADQSEAQGTGM